MSTVLTAPRRPAERYRVRRLGEYTASQDGCPRQIVSLRRADGALLVLDCLGDTLADARLVARLAPEEPAGNAALVCEIYLADATRGRCRRLGAADLSPTTGSEAGREDAYSLPYGAPLIDAAGRAYRIGVVTEEGSFPALRWTDCSCPSAPPEVLTLRDVVAQLESYEPARTFSIGALAVHGHDQTLSTSCLSCELKRVTCSPIVLNRGLREAVARAVASGGLTRSEIAMRCGRTKRDRRRALSGETSWLARRIGELPEGGQSEPTPWIHSDTLALIARQGLGLSPNEVEL